MSTTEQTKCSRSSKHEAGGNGDGNRKTKVKIANSDGETDSVTGSVRNGSVNSQQSNGDNISISGSRTSLRSGNPSISGSRQSLRSGNSSISGSRQSLKSGNSVSGSRTSLRSGDHDELNQQDDDTISRTSVSFSTQDDDGSRSSSRASSTRQQRPKTSMQRRGPKQSSRASPDANSISSRQSYDNDDFEAASFTEDTHDFTQYVDLVRQESSRLSQREDLDPLPLDVSLLHSVLGDLTLSLKDSEARSLRIYEEIEEVREATIELKRTLFVKMGESVEEEDATKDQNGNKKDASRALATARAAKAALAELALEVAEASKMAAEAEKAAAEAAALAEEVTDQVEETDGKLTKFEETDDERKQKAKEEAEEEAKRKEEEEQKQNDEVTPQDDTLEEEVEQKGESDEENKKDALPEKQQEPEKPKKIEPPKSKKENPLLDWPYYPLNLIEDGEEYEDDIGCILRYKVDDFQISPKFTCTLISDPTLSLLSDSEELISDVISLERVDEIAGDKLSTHIVVAIPYTSNTRMAATREFVVKFLARGEDEEWKVLPTLSIEGSYKEVKSPFVEFKVNRIGVFAVVARLGQDRQTISKKGGVVRSSTDNRMTVTYPPKCCTLISVTLRIQPAESAVTDLKERMRHCSDLIAASPIIHMTHSTKKPFEKPITLTIPCPPNPHKGTGIQTASKPEKSRSEPLRPEGAVVIRSTKSSLFGGDPSNDSLHVLFRQGNSSVWNELEGVDIKQVRKDVVAVDLTQPVDRLVVLRMTAEPRYPIQNVTNTFEKALQIKYANIILQLKEDDPQQVAVLCVPSKQLENAMRRLTNDGYEAQTEPSQDIPMTEGQEITLRFTGNIKIIGHEEMKFTFHSHKRSLVEFTITESNRFGNYSSTEYRGMAEFYGEPRIRLEDMEDPEEVLLREAEAKAAEKENKGEDDKKKGKGQKSQDKDKNKELIDNDAARGLLCKLPVSLPKAEPDPPLPPSRYRTTAIDVGGIVSNNNLKWLSTELGNEWESLSGYLGIKRSRLQSIKRNNPSKQDQQILDMLITWRSQVPKSYNKEKKLCSALTRCGRYDLAEELRYREEEFEEGNED